MRMRMGRRLTWPILVRAAPGIVKASLTAREPLRIIPAEVPERLDSTCKRRPGPRPILDPSDTVSGPSAPPPPAPYPGELERFVELTDGRRLRIRAIRPEDEPRLVEFHGRLSQHTAYQRFFTILRRLPPNWAHFFANVDYRTRLALVADHEVEGRAELVGVGRYEPSGEPGTAEVAFVVQDGWQGLGLGKALLADVLAAAEARGVHRFRAYVLPDNRRMLGLLARFTAVEERKMEDRIVSLVFRRKKAATDTRKGT